MMSDDRKSLEHMKDLMTPGLNGTNDKFNKNHKLSIEGDKLKLSNGMTVIDNARCKNKEDQLAQLNVAFKQLREGV